MQSPFVSVIVCTAGSRPSLKLCLQSLLKQTYKNYEIIVVSPSPSDIEGMICERLRYVKDPGRGLGGARNAGVKSALGDIFVFVDDDTIQTSDYIESIVKSVTGGADIVGGPIEPLYLSPPPSWWSEKDLGPLLSINRAGDAKYYKVIYGANFAVTRRVVQRVGAFREALGRRGSMLLSNEETDFFNRASKAGFHPHFSINVRVKHIIPPCRITITYLLKSSYFQGFSDLLMLWFMGRFSALKKFVRVTAGFGYSLVWFFSKLEAYHRMRVLTDIAWRCGFLLAIFSLKKFVMM